MGRRGRISPGGWTNAITHVINPNHLEVIGLPTKIRNYWKYEEF